MQWLLLELRGKTCLRDPYFTIYSLFLSALSSLETLSSLIATIAMDKYKHLTSSHRFSGSLSLLYATGSFGLVQRHAVVGGNFVQNIIFKS